MNNLFPKVSPKEVQKSPYGYLMLVMAALLGAFVNWGINSKDKADSDKVRLYEKIIAEDKESDRKRDSIYEVKLQVLQLRIDYFVNNLVKKDSTDRAILEKPLKDLLKQVRKNDN